MKKNSENIHNTLKIIFNRQDKPPVVFNIVVPGVGLEPTKAFARGS
jgi:hypothetical protein